MRDDPHSNGRSSTTSPSVRAPTGRWLILDCDGVLYLDDEPISGVAGALDELSRAWSLLFVTNNSSRSLDEAAKKIELLTGYPARHGQVVNSGLAATTRLHSDDAAFVVGETGLVSTLRDAGISVVDDAGEATVVVVGLDRGLTYRRLAEATLALRNGARLLATNDDATYPTPHGLVPGAGAIVAALEASGGVTAEVAGKPHLPMVDLVARAVSDTDDVWVVGDKLESDIALAKRGGWRSILVRSGVFDDSAEIPKELRPDAIVDSIAEVGGVVTSDSTTQSEQMG